MSPWLQLIVNTPNTSVVGLRCVGVVFDNKGEIIRKMEADINITIYGMCLIHNVLWPYDLSRSEIESGT